MEKHWIEIELIDGVEKINYGWQAEDLFDRIIFTRVKDGKRKEIFKENIIKIIHK